MKLIITTDINKMIEFTVHTKKKDQDLLKQIPLFLKVTNISNKTIEIAKELHEFVIYENGKRIDSFTHFYNQHQLTYITLKPNESFETKCEIKYYISFQNLYKNKKQNEKIIISTNAIFYVKGLPNHCTEFIKSQNTLKLEVDFTSVEFLLTPDNKLSEYIIYKGNIVHTERPCKKINIDKNSLKILDEIYIADKDKVYKYGNLQRIKPKGFKVFNELYAGNDEKILTTYGDAKIKDPKTFEVFNVYKEGDSVYRRGYARDQYHLYFFDEWSGSNHAKICRACKTPSTFKELYPKDGGLEVYGICERTVYINGISISMAEAKTWQDLGMYSKDRKNVFYFTYKVKGADPDSFEVIKDPEAGKYYSFLKKYEYTTLEESRWGKDKNHYYDCGKRSSKEAYLNKKEKFENS